MNHTYSVVLKGGPLHGERRVITQPVMRCLTRAGERQYTFRQKDGQKTYERLKDGSFWLILDYDHEDAYMWEVLRKLDQMIEKGKEPQCFLDYSALRILQEAKSKLEFFLQAETDYEMHSQSSSSGR